VVAIYEYQNHVEGDICFDKGDVMVLLDDRFFKYGKIVLFFLYNSNFDWWYVKHPKNGVGYAPRNFLARIESLEVCKHLSGADSIPKEWFLMNLLFYKIFFLFYLLITNSHL
jgi:hypothetical protein